MARFCSTCGKEVHENAVICVHCGCEIPQMQNTLDDKPNMGLNILSLFFPIVGLVLFCVNLEKKPTSAKSYGVWALIGFVAGICLSACTMIIA